MPPEIESFTHPQGGATGTIGFDIIDPTQLKNGHAYEITFRDTVYKIDNKDVVKTLSFSLQNVMENRILLADDRRVVPGDEITITEGIPACA